MSKDYYEIMMNNPEPYPGIMNGDRAEFEIEWAGKDPKERPDWPLPSVNAMDWAEAFCKIANKLGYKDAKGESVDLMWMVGWFACALQRGMDEGLKAKAYAEDL